MTTAHRFAIVTAADDAYFPLLQGLVRSIQGFPQGAVAPIVVLDVGLGPAARDWLGAQAVRRLEPGWDHRPDRLVPDYMKAMLSRPHLPRHVPEAELILWLDADCWVQDWNAVELLLRGAEATGFAIVPELDRSYTPLYNGAPYALHLYEWYKACFDEATARHLHVYPLLNCGVFAARRDAPHWDLWGRLLADALRRVILFVSEQVALNVALRTGGLPFSQLPAACNWICFRATPLCSEDGRLLLDPQLPHAPLGIVHLVGYHRAHKAEPRSLSTPGGGTMIRPLAYVAAAPPPSLRDMPLAQALALAFSLYQDGRAADGRAVCRAILAVRPDQVEASFLLGVTEFALGFPSAARSRLAVTVALKPDLADAYSNLALLASAAETVPLLTYALRLLGGQASAQTVTQLGTALRETGRARTAVAVHRRSLALQPESANAHREMGHALRASGALSAAATAYGRAWVLAPDQTGALSDRLFATLSACDWRDHAALSRSILQVIDGDLGLAMPLLTLLIDSSPAQQDRSARIFYEAMVRPAEPAESTPWRPVGADGRLTVAYLSADFHEHATAHLTAELFELHDRARFRVLGYSQGPDDGSPMRRRLEAGFDLFRDIRGLDAASVAAALAADGVHILVDLKGYTRDARLDLLARRLAPVQVAYLGYPGTLGAETIDYAIGDRIVTPPEHQPYYRERLVRMPDAYQVNDRRRPLDAPVPSRAACGLPPDGVVLCAFNAPFKITPTMFALWMRVLADVPGSILWLMDANPEATANLRRAAARHGIAPDRLVFAPHRPQAEHLARYRLADLFLDSFPYTGHTTVSDALWMGLPVMTRLGDTFASRVAASLLTATGLPETITGSLAEYEELAVRLARAPDRLAAYRDRLERGRVTAPLFDTPRFARHLESAYRLMWERYAAGLPPEPFTVPVLPAGG
ncbi:O-linked N-acetylglucosamine transferase, SPINDLY family protein [Azospirillum picis]|uniref:protein O-GlcNAc transferase n=1 Tax=Azospirillum picis TaxID=488438 RepID=A0ABU0MSV0_9PROT|nr:hypothetical protein [Azospirillum picis]MBP2302745.1 putative O-linked N-acetylglucosamine transferase (SPINDLY family) [Azospirillum picis]MDQ0536496.1 putative O-linked N-acetylglucosamine transferase (SPINDLY family) [Azospirillum picis]